MSHNLKQTVDQGVEKGFESVVALQQQMQAAETILLDELPAELDESLVYFRTDIIVVGVPVASTYVAFPRAQIGKLSKATKRAMAFGLQEAAISEMVTAETTEFAAKSKLEDIFEAA